MASQAHSGAAAGSEGPGGGDGSGGPGDVLVGNVGQEYVQATLTTMDPLTAIQVGAGRRPVGAGGAASAAAVGGGCGCNALHSVRA